jgi:hypothetical protein
MYQVGYNLIGPSQALDTIKENPVKSVWLAITRLNQKSV